MATLSSVVTDHASLNEADELEAAKQIAAQLSTTNRYLYFKHLVDSMSDAEQIGFNTQYKADTGKELQFIDAPDAYGIQKVKKLQPATGA